MKQQEDRSTELNAGMGYNALIDSVGINVCKLLLDDELTILWGNDNFYISSGFTKAEYQTLFPSIKAYYAGHGEEFHKIKMHLPPPQKSWTQGQGRLPQAA